MVFGAAATVIADGGAGANVKPVRAVANPASSSGSGAGYQPKAEQDVVRVQADTVLALDKLSVIDTGTDKRYVKRRRDGTFKESDDVGKSLAADRRQKATKKVKPGYGDQGDQPKRAAKKASKK